MGARGPSRGGAGLEAFLLVLGGVLLAVGNARDWVPAKSYTPTPREPGTLRVVTWNVGEGLAEGGAPLQRDALPAVVRTLGELEPDLVLLQELSGRRQLGELRRALGDGWEALLARGGGRSVAALVRQGDLERSGSPEGESDHGDSARVLRVRFRTPEGCEVHATSLHASAFSAAARNRTIGAAVDQLTASKLDGSESAPLRILAGDFNLDLDLDKRRDLFTDDSHLDVETYNYVARVLVDAARGRGATADPDRRLDYVFLGGEDLEVRAAGPWKGRRVGNMDHDPVVADVRWACQVHRAAR